MNRAALLFIFLIVFYVLIQVVNVNAIPEAIKYKGTRWKYVGRAEINISIEKPPQYSTQDHRVICIRSATYTVTNVYSDSIEVRRSYCEEWYVDGIYDGSLSRCDEETFRIPLMEYTNFWVPVNPPIGAIFSVRAFGVDGDVFWSGTFRIESIGSDVIIAKNEGNTRAESYWAWRLYGLHIYVDIEYRQVLRFRRDDGLRIAYSDHHRAVNNDYGYCLIYDYNEKLEYIHVPYYRVDIVINGLPSDLSTDIYIDGVHHSKMRSGETKCLYFPIGSSHEIAVRELIDLGSTRYVCRNNRFRVSTDTTVTFTYNVEYKVVVDVNPRITLVIIDGVSYTTNNLPVELWRSKDSTIKISLGNVEISYGNYKYVFSSWSDGVKTVERTIIVNNPATYIAKYVLYYPFNVELVAKGEYVRANVYVDGVKLIGNFIPEGRHIVMVDKVVEAEPSWKRYVFAKWSTGETSNIIEINVSSPLTIKAIYKTQYYLRIDSKFEVGGSGWYDEDSTVDISLEKSIVDIDEDTRYSFIGWSGDHVGSEARFSITMNKPKVITANWIKQYRVIVTYNPGYVGDDEIRWCNENSRELFRADEIIAVSSDVRYRFLNWEGISRDLNIEVTITNPLKLIKNYKRQYLVTLTSSYGNPVIRELGSISGWIDYGEYITVSVEKAVGFPIRKVFNGWYDEQDNLISKDSEYMLRVDKPLKLNAKHTNDYTPLLVIVGSIAVACVSLFLYKRRVKPRFEAKPIVEKPLVKPPPPPPELTSIISEINKITSEVERYENYMNELERKRGELSGNVYVRLKSIYESEINQRKSRIEELTNEAIRMGAWRCVKCGIVNLPNINTCQKCGWRQQ